MSPGTFSKSLAIFSPEGANLLALQQVLGVQLQASFVQAGERERTLYLHIIHISENMKKNSLKWLKCQKNTFKSPKIYRKMI
jgi:hypothetical protein